MLYPRKRYPKRHIMPNIRAPSHAPLHLAPLNKNPFYFVEEEFISHYPNYNLLYLSPSPAQKRNITDDEHITMR